MVKLLRRAPRVIQGGTTERQHLLGVGREDSHWFSLGGFLSLVRGGQLSPTFFGRVDDYRISRVSYSGYCCSVPHGGSSCRRFVEVSSDVWRIDCKPMLAAKALPSDYVPQ